MPTAYDDITAKHYEAYRPPLHSIILGECINKTERFQYGLDVGCGTGRSSIALKAYCEKVLGIDPSQEMLNKVVVSTNINYEIGRLEDLQLKENTFDIITFAGSLFYARSQELLNEVIRVSKPNAKIIIYDFAVDFAFANKILEIQSNMDLQEYNHAVNFSGLESHSLQPIIIVQKQRGLPISSLDLNHLVLSEMHLYKQLTEKWNTKEVFKQALKSITKASEGKTYNVNTTLFYSVYENNK